MGNDKYNLIQSAREKKKCEWNSIIKNHVTKYHWNHLYRSYVIIFRLCFWGDSFSVHDIKREMIHLYNKLGKSQQLSTFIAATMSYNRLFTLRNNWPNWKPYVTNSHLVRCSIFQKTDTTYTHTIGWNKDSAEMTMVSLAGGYFMTSFVAIARHTWKKPQVLFSKHESCIKYRRRMDPCKLKIIVTS